MTPDKIVQVYTNMNTPTNKFITAIGDKDTKSLKTLINTHKNWTTFVDTDGQSMIFLAVKSNHIDSVKTLLSSLSSDKTLINKPNNEKITPLMCAAQIGNLDIFKLLIANGSDLLGELIDDDDDYDDYENTKTSYLYAIRNEKHDIVDYIIRYEGFLNKILETSYDMLGLFVEYSISHMLCKTLNFILNDKTIKNIKIEHINALIIGTSFNYLESTLEEMRTLKDTPKPSDKKKWDDFCDIVGILEEYISLHIPEFKLQIKEHIEQKGEHDTSDNFDIIIECIKKREKNKSTSTSTSTSTGSC